MAYMRRGLRQVYPAGWVNNQRWRLPVAESDARVGHSKLPENL